MSALAKALELTPLIERVHGSDHPELTRVRELTEELSTATDRAAKSTLFAQLRELTDNYTVPSGGCEAYQDTYAALKAADSEHRS